ncbi:MAG TPA: LysM peptidoglycan-binding domain-containing protein [Bacillota bacterium]|nr:LysM peptidoglycan-binding domain-containing protein [Bacillota bacterium]
MKRICFLLATVALCAAAPVRGQDAATEERLNKLNGQLEDLIARQTTLKNQLEAVTKELETVREQLNNKPVINYASQEDLKRLAEAVKEIDRKRLEDYDKIRTELKKLVNLAASAPVPPRHLNASASDTPEPSKPAKSEKGFEYVVKSGDTLSLIVQAYQDNNVKVSMAQVLKANPGLKPEKMRVGQKIFIPAP